jgi:hypothetical protein
LAVMFGHKWCSSASSSCLCPCWLPLRKQCQYLTRMMTILVLQGNQEKETRNWEYWSPVWPKTGEEIKRWYERSAHEKRVDQTCFLFSPTHPNWSSQEFHTPVWDFHYMHPPPLLFIFFTKSSVERIKSFQNLWADTQFQSVCNYTQIEDQTGITGSN